MNLDIPSFEGFEWDSANLGHIKKHDVFYGECEEIFFNKPLLVNADEGHSQNEERFQALGVTRESRLLFIVFIVRNNKIRVVSARDQNKKERRPFQNLGGEFS